MSLSPPRTRLSVEPLEDRLTPTFGTPWLDGSSLTLSFVPDGTNISGQPSNLSATLGATTTQAQWERVILQAYQTWAVQANLNIGLVADGGQPMGVAGPSQGDIRFGDIRIGARPLSAPGTPGSTMADANGFDYDSQTWAGDLVFNSQYQFGIGGTPNQQSDLFTVALHEAGHSFGLADTSTDPTSAMYAQYGGILAGPSAADIAALQALYGPRQNDAYEGTSGNSTLAAAYPLGNLTALSAGVNQIGDVDLFKFVTPAWGATGLTVALKASGISFLTGRLSVLDAQGNTVASAVTTDPTNNDLSITVPNYQPSTTYYVKVQGASSDVFSVGAYVLKLNYAGGGGGQSAVTSAFNVNVETFANNNTQAGATTLNPVRASKANTFVLLGAVASSSDVDWYKITPTLPTATTGTLFVGTMTTTNGLLPAVSVYNALGQVLPTVVTMNQSGSYEVQLANATTGTTYFIRVAAAAASSTGTTGIYSLGATLAPIAPTTFNSVTSGTLSTGNSVSYTQMQVTGDRLTQFALSATGGSATAETAVRVTIFDSNGHAVFTAVTIAGAPLTTGAVWLASGTYTVVFNASTQDGSAFQALGVSLSARKLTDPIDPYLEDPLAPPPQPLMPVSAPAPTPMPPPDPIVDPISDPFAGLSTFSI
jgi:hypothetical protein